jgi:hypothetical protein
VNTAALDVKLSAPETLEIKSRGIPHLAKNERDMGHPQIGCRFEWMNCTNRLVSKDKSLHTSRPDSDLIALRFVYERLATREDDALSLGFFLEAGSDGKSGNFGRPRSADHPVYPLATVLG